MTHIRFPNAAVATGESHAKQHSHSNPTPQSSTILWALNAYAGRLGQYISVKQRGAQIYVGVKSGPTLRWVPAEQALTNQEAQCWIAKAQFAT